MADLALHRDEHRPARLVGMPVRLAAQLAQQRLVERLEQRRQRLQPAGKRARGHVQSVIGQII